MYNVFFVTVNICKTLFILVKRMFDKRYNDAFFNPLLFILNLVCPWYLPIWSKFMFFDKLIVIVVYLF